MNTIKNKNIFQALNFQRKLNKKAYYNFDDLGMFFLTMIIVGAGIVLGFLIFYSVKVDIRIEEAKTMSDKLRDVVVNGGVFNEEVLSGSFDILKEAGIDGDVVNNGDFYFNLTVYQNGKAIKSYNEGTRIFEVNCFLKGENFPECYSNEFDIEEGGGVYRIKILSGSKQLGSKL